MERTCRKTALRVAVLLLMAHLSLVAWLGFRQSPNIDEVAHLAAGMSMWQYGSLELYCVNPPLMRAFAALPALCMRHEAVWGDFAHAPQPRPEFLLGSQFVESHPEQWRKFLIAGRWAVLPFTALGGIVCYLWASALFGRRAGLLALLLWCFSPNVLTWSSMIGTDTAAAATGVLAGFAFWRLLRESSWRQVGLAGLCLGLALLSKATWILLFAVWPALWCLASGVGLRRGTTCLSLRQLAATLLIGVYVLNLGYAFEGTFRRLGDYKFHSRVLVGASDGERQNRFVGTVLERLPIPFPEPFIRGIDLQKADFEQERPSYLFGEWSDRGRWYYYIAGLGLKVPLGTWMLGLLAVLNSCRRAKYAQPSDAGANRTWADRQAGCTDHLAVILPALAVLLLVSSQYSFSDHFRYVLPAMPFAFVWISQAANLFQPNRPWPAAVAAFALVWSVVSTLSVYPHTMTYFNELAGGPRNGHRCLLGTSFSWAQDYFYLKDWVRAHPEVDSPYVHLARSISLERLGIRSRGLPPPFRSIAGKTADPSGSSIGPVPGWHVMDIQRILEPSGDYRYYLEFEPVAKVGYSTYVYQIRWNDANRVRLNLGLDTLPASNYSPAEFLSELVADSREPSRRMRVALFSASEFDAQPAVDLQQAIEDAVESQVSRLSEHDIRVHGLDGFDVLVVPGGSAHVQGAALGNEGRVIVRDFVREGGGYVGICAGAFLAASGHDWSLSIVNANTMTGERFVPGEGIVKGSFRDWGTVAVELTNHGRQLFEVDSNPLRLDYTGGPIFSRANHADLPDYMPLAVFRTETWRYPFQRGTMVDSPAILAAKFGRGRVILFSPHPEGSYGSHELLATAIRVSAKNAN